MVSVLLWQADHNSDWSLRYLWIAYSYLSYLLPVGITVSCALILKRSLSSGLLSKRFLVGTLALWSVFVVATVALAFRLSPAIPASTPMIAYVIGIAMLVVPLAATTATPLGLAVHRHA